MCPISVYMNVSWKWINRCYSFRLTGSTLMFIGSLGLRGLLSCKAMFWCEYISSLFPLDDSTANRLHDPLLLSTTTKVNTVPLNEALKPRLRGMELSWLFACKYGDVFYPREMLTVFSSVLIKNRELQIMRKLDHCNIVRLRYFFYCSGEKVKHQW